MKEKKPVKQEACSNLVPLFGRDEMNLVEFPFGPITPQHGNTLTVDHEVRDRKTKRVVTRKLVITGSDAFGLPRPTDDRVLMGMNALTCDAGFASRRVEFSRYRLCQIIGWPVSGRTYQQLEDSFDRIAGTTLKFKDAWWDKGEQQYRSHTFHLIDRVELCSIGRYENALSTTGEKSHALCCFVWNEVVWKSFQDGNIKRVDLDMFRRIANGRRRDVPLRLYRWLDKRFYNAEVVRMDAMKLGAGTLGIAGSYPSQIIRVIQRACDVLTDCGFLGASKTERRKDGRTEFVFLKRAPAKPAAVQKEEPRQAAKREDALLKWARGTNLKTLTEAEEEALRVEFGSRFEREIVTAERGRGVAIQQAGRTRLLYLKRFIDEAAKERVALAG